MLYNILFLIALNSLIIDWSSKILKLKKNEIKILNISVTLKHPWDNNMASRFKLSVISSAFKKQK